MNPRSELKPAIEAVLRRHFTDEIDHETAITTAAEALADAILQPDTDPRDRWEPTEQTPRGIRLDPDHPKQTFRITDDTYFIFYADHPRGTSPGFALLEGIRAAQDLERQLGHSGFRWTESRHVMSLAEIPE